jgi:hypothetical protein
MKNTQNEIVETSKTKGSWASILSDLKRHFTLEPDAGMKFIPPRQNELLSSIETRLNRYRAEVSKVSNNNYTEKA